MRPTRALIYTGGISHPFEQAAPVLAQLLNEVGFAAVVSFDLNAIVAALQDDPQALLVIYALRWGMTQHEKYAPDRAQWALQIAEPARHAISGHVRGGGGLLGIHTASICFDDWAEWPQVLGGGWQWGISHHPPLGPVEMTLDAAHPLAQGLPNFSLMDEAYTQLAVSPAAAIVARVTAAGGVAEPAVWTHQYGAGRVFYDSVGHDGASLSERTHRQLLQRGARWAAGI
jgi:type 1 glutamine amidotransferase